METNTIKPLTLLINKEVWNSFKTFTPRTIKLNDAVVKLIEDEVKKHKTLTENLINETVKQE